MIILIKVQVDVIIFNFCLMKRTIIFSVVGGLILIASFLYYSSTQTELAMEDMVLQPKEVPQGFSPMVSVPWENPGFITGNDLTETLSNLGTIPSRVSRVYAAIYKNYDTAGDLSIIVLEYKNTTELNEDLMNMRTKTGDSEIAGTKTYTVYGNYIIIIGADELADELTKQLKTKLSI